MSIFNRFFGRDAKTLFAENNPRELVEIRYIKSFKPEFMGKNPYLLHDGDSTMYCRSIDSIFVNGINFNLTAIFEANTPEGDAFTLENVTAIHEFSATRATDNEGNYVDLFIHPDAEFDIITLLKSHIQYDSVITEPEHEIFA